MKFLGNLILVFGTFLIIAMFAAGILDSMTPRQEQKSNLLPTSAIVAVLPTAEKFPTYTPAPTSTNTPVPTMTAIPTKTLAPTIEPSPTEDLEYIKKRNDIDLEYQQKLADIRQQESDTFWGGAWNLGYFVSFLIVVLGATAIIIQAYRRKPKPVQNDAHTHPHAQELQKTENDIFPCPLGKEAQDEFKRDYKIVKSLAHGAWKSHPLFINDNDGLRAWLIWLDQKGYAVKVPPHNERILTADGAVWFGIEPPPQP